jgi:hypothetical protein
MNWVIKKEKYLAESYYWEGKKEIESEDHFVYYDNGEIKYQIHSADRTSGQNTGKWVCYFDRPIEEPIAKNPIDLWKNAEGYMGVKNGDIVFCGGNGLFNAIGLPEIAEYNSIEEAKKVCELHNQNPSKVKSYTPEESRRDFYNEMSKK